MQVKVRCQQSQSCPLYYPCSVPAITLKRREAVVQVMEAVEEQAGKPCSARFKAWLDFCRTLSLEVRGLACFIAAAVESAVMPLNCLQ